MKKFAVQSIGLIVIIGVVLVFFSPFGNTPNLNIPFFPSPPQIKTLEINGNKLKMEIADSESKRNKGLSGRDSLGGNEGMLFIYPKAAQHPFWMKGMKISLDFVWIKDDKVVDIIPGVPPPDPGTKDADLPIYSSKFDTDKILEVNAGLVQKLNIKVGDTIKLQ